MENLVENQNVEDQVSLNETEELEGGFGCGQNTCYGNVCIPNWADEDDSDNVAL